MNDLELDKKRVVVDGTEKYYFDFIISGQPLSGLLNIGEDLAGFIGFWNSKNDKREIRLLTKRQKSELISGRIILYGCMRCGDIGCGAVTVNIVFEENKIVWKEFGYEDNDGVPDLDEYKAIGPFEFDINSYLRAFQSIQTDR